MKVIKFILFYATVIYAIVIMCLSFEQTDSDFWCLVFGFIAMASATCCFINEEDLKYIIPFRFLREE